MQTRINRENVFADMKNQPIGIFDSGIGGLTVLKEVENILPSENIVYFGDTARVPYGNKSKSTIIKFSIENVLFLLKKKVKIVVIACNTSSSLALEYLKSVFNIPILGVIEAGANKAVRVSLQKRIGVIGTKSTIESKSYEREIRKIDKKATVYTQSCPFFVPLAEEGMSNGKIVNEAIDMYLKDFRKWRIDTLILGCTHYPLFKPEIARFLKDVFIVDSAKEVACHTKNILAANKLLNTKKRKSLKEFYVSDEPKDFTKLAKLFLKRNISKPKIIHI